MAGRIYVAIDLKSFYASSECVEHGFPPLSTHLVVADQERTDKTICLAISPSLKAYGLPGRARLFEVKAKLKEINAVRRAAAPGGVLTGKSYDAKALAANPNLAADVFIAKPRMSHYLAMSAKIYGIYLKYVSAEDIHVYSVDEVFMDVTGYLRAYGKGVEEMTRDIIRDIHTQTGITATAGIGTNMYLAKVAMDIVAKHIQAGEDGIRIARLDEMSYRRLLWNHRPLTDFWRVGRGYARKLEAHGLATMGDIARCSIGRADEYYNEDLLYKMFGVNAELLIDHAWGWEPCTIADIKVYKPAGHSLSSGQVLTGPAGFDAARLIVREMADTLSLDLVAKGVKAGRVGLMVGYDTASLDPKRLGKDVSADLKAIAEHAAATYDGPVSIDRYGRRVPKPATGSIALPEPTSAPAMRSTRWPAWVRGGHTCRSKQGRRMLPRHVRQSPSNQRKHPCQAVSDRGLPCRSRPSIPLCRLSRPSLPNPMTAYPPFHAQSAGLRRIPPDLSALVRNSSCAPPACTL